VVHRASAQCLSLQVLDVQWIEIKKVKKNGFETEE